MLCSLCTVEVVRGPMYRTTRSRHYVSEFRICAECKSLVDNATPIHVDEPRCDCGLVHPDVCLGMKTNCPIRAREVS